MRIDFTQGGIHLPDLGLWLDSTEPCEATWVSHGHSDHAGGAHLTVIGTPETLRFFRMRNEESRDAAMVRLAYGAGIEFGGASLTAVPAGHILGAAQLLIEWRGERVVYTGDIKLKAPLAGATTEIVPCDRLILESTFGLPIYRFLDREQARERILRFARECLDDGLSPAFLGYPLGRGQEIAMVLCQGGIPTAVHGAIARMIPPYEAAGHAFPGWEAYDPRKTSGKAVVVTPGLKNVLEAAGRFRVAYVSGWAALDNARARAGAEELIAYSDHAGFDELLELVERSGASEIDVVHGYTEPFARILRERGFGARAAGGARGDAEAEG